MSKQYAALFSHYSADTGEPRAFDDIHKAAAYAGQVIAAQPGIQFVLLVRDHPGTEWRTKVGGRNIRQAVQFHFADAS